MSKAQEFIKLAEDQKIKTEYKEYSVKEIAKVVEDLMSQLAAYMQDDPDTNKAYAQTRTLVDNLKRVK